MSTREKIARVAAVQDAFSLMLALRVIGLPKTTWYYHQHHVHDYAEKYAYLRTPLENIARDHPEYGYRRTTVELREQTQEAINHKVIQNLQQLWDLPLLSHTHHPRPSGIRQVIAGAGERVNLLATLTRVECLQAAMPCTPISPNSCMPMVSARRT